MLPHKKGFKKQHGTAQKEKQFFFLLLLCSTKGRHTLTEAKITQCVCLGRHTKMVQKCSEKGRLQSLLAFLDARVDRRTGPFESFVLAALRRCLTDERGVLAAAWRGDGPLSS